MKLNPTTRSALISCHESCNTIREFIRPFPQQLTASESGSGPIPVASFWTLISANKGHKGAVRPPTPTPTPPRRCQISRCSNVPNGSIPAGLPHFTITQHSMSRRTYSTCVIFSNSLKWSPTGRFRIGGQFQVDRKGRSGTLRRYENDEGQ